MRVQIDNYLLVPHNEEEIVLNRIRWNGQRTPDVKAFTLAEWVKVFDRGARSTSVELEVTRRHATIQDAEIFLADHDNDIPTSGLVKFTFVGAQNQLTLRFLKDAAIEAASSDVIVGLTTLHQYRIIAGKVLETEPTS